MWYFRFHEAITAFGLTMVLEDHCLYVKKTNVGIMFLTLYVDDILLAGSSLELINAIERWLSSVFDMKDMDEARYFLGVEIIRHHPRKLLGLCQRHTLRKSWNVFRCMTPNLLIL